MAEVKLQETRVQLERRVPARLSWGAIFGGTFVALGVWMLMLAFGLAVGLSSVNPANLHSLQSGGVFSGIWGLISPLVALFFGGMVAARAADLLDRGSGSLHAAVLWGLTSLVAVWLLGSLVTSVVGGAARLAGGVVGGASQAVAGMARSGAPGQVAQQLGVDWNSLLAPLNQRLRAEGRPEVTVNQLQAAAGAVVNDALAGRPLNRQLLVADLTRNTSLSAQDANALADQVEARVNQLRGQAGGVAQNVQQGALQAAKATGKAFWGVFGSLLLSLITAVAGALVGVARRQQLEAGRAERVRVPLAGRREVYP